MWTGNSDPFGADAANPAPSGAGVCTFNLQFPGQLFGVNTSAYERQPNLSHRFIGSVIIYIRWL